MPTAVPVGILVGVPVPTDVPTGVAVCVAVIVVTGVSVGVKVGVMLRGEVFHERQGRGGRLQIASAAQTSIADTAATARIALRDSPTLGLSKTDQAMPSQCSTRLFSTLLI